MIEQLGLGSKNSLQGDWKFRITEGKSGIANIPTVNMKTGEIGKVRIPFAMIDDSSLNLGETMEETIEWFGGLHG